jgi:plastocyanin
VATTDFKSLLSRTAARVGAAASMIGLVLVLGAAPLRAEEPVKLLMSIKDHRFEPAELHVPAGKRVVIELTNEDSTSEEFDSHALKVEKVVTGKSKGLVRIGPLKPGRYEFVGEFHEATAKGVVVAE